MLAATADVDQAFTRIAEDTASASSSISESAAAAYVRPIGKAQEMLEARCGLSPVGEEQHALALSRRSWTSTSTCVVCGNCRSGTT
ncbi:hypothetical protein ACFC6U_33340 [Kitasatospora purpeofusca]|uniref:hypothetical protein n=1 Tax=Kitasatospora purpeofusca TaxID=67352 RepID=UPI0035DD2BE4